MTPTNAINLISRAQADLDSLENRLARLQEAGVVHESRQLRSGLKLLRSHLGLAKLDQQEKCNAKQA